MDAMQLLHVHTSDYPYLGVGMGQLHHPTWPSPPGMLDKGPVPCGQ